MQYCLIAEIAQTCMSMHNLHFFPDNDVAKDGEERENRGKGGFAIDDEEWDVINFDAICQIPYPCSVCVGMREHDDLVPTID